MQRSLVTALLACSTYLALDLTVGGVAWAGTIAAQGNVTALDDITQITSITGQALFDEEYQGIIPADQYPGLTFHTGELGMILPGVVEMGEVLDPMFTSPGVYFPYPIAGGGQQVGYICLTGGALTFDDPVTQFGVTAGGYVTMYMTAWDTSGALIGQVSWTPDQNEGLEAAFVGIDTMGVPIGLLTIGGDDVFGGDPYDDLGPTARTDTWIWGVAAPCQSEADCLEDGWSCTARACTNGACEYPLTTEPCDDANACTDQDVCNEGLCAGATISCADTEVCTFDSCDPDIGCTNEAIEGCCYTDADCPEGQECLLSSNTCVPGPPPPPPPPPDDTETSGGDGDAETTGTTGAATEDGGGGCSCSTNERGGGALFGLLVLVALAGVRRRDED